MKTFVTSKELYKHIESLHEGRQFKCSKCLKTFITCLELDEHIEFVHEGGKFKCQKKCASKHSLQVRNYRNIKSPFMKGGNSSVPSTLVHFFYSNTLMPKAKGQEAEDIILYFNPLCLLLLVLRPLAFEYLSTKIGHSRIRVQTTVLLVLRPMAIED